MYKLSQKKRNGTTHFKCQVAFGEDEKIWRNYWRRHRFYTRFSRKSFIKIQISNPWLIKQNRNHICPEFSWIRKIPDRRRYRYGQRGRNLRFLAKTIGANSHRFRSISICENWSRLVHHNELFRIQYGFWKLKIRRWWKNHGRAKRQNWQIWLNFERKHPIKKPGPKSQTRHHNDELRTRARISLRSVHEFRRLHIEAEFAAPRATENTQTRKNENPNG